MKEQFFDLITTHLHHFHFSRPNMECKDKNNPESSNPQIKAVERLWPFMQEEDKTKIREIIEKNQSNLHQTRQDNTHIEVKFYGFDLNLNHKIYWMYRQAI